MTPLFLYLEFPVVLTVLAIIAGLRWWHNLRGAPPGEYAKCRRHLRSYADLCGWCRTIPGTVAILAAVLWVIPVGVAVSRSVNQTACERRAELTGRPYEWFDIHFFSYECVLRTPSGNATTTPVIPFEDMSERGDR